VLKEKTRAYVRVFVVWEPVLTTDWARPGAGLTSLIDDPRVEQFWDRSRRLSEMYGGASKLDTLAGVRKVGFRMKDVVWDSALIYPPGTRWGQPAKLLLAPVVKFRAELSGSL